MVREKWRLLDLEYDDPCMNLAVEEAIPRVLGKGLSLNTIRFWRNPNTVVVGRFQDLESEVNFDACRKYGTRVVRRFTGGGAVYQDHGNLNYAISVRRDNPLVAEDILETSERLSRGIVRGLEPLGVRAEYRKPNGLFVGDKKISGSAGAVKWGVFFHHGTLLVNSSLKVLSEVLATPMNRFRSKRVRSVPQTTTTLKDCLGRGTSIESVRESLIRGIEDVYDIDLVEGELLKEERKLAEKLLKEEYFTLFP